jgi:hypothetical protein
MQAMLTAIESNFPQGRIAMKRRKFLTVISILAALILALIAVIPASADAPDNYTDYVADHWVYHCDEGFDITLGYTGWYHWVIDWDEGQGNAIVSTFGYVYRNDKPEVVYNTKPNHWNGIIRLGSGKGVMTVGTWDHMVMPGVGVFYLNAGRVLYDSDLNIIKVVGSWDIEGDYSGVCAALAQ